MKINLVVSLLYLLLSLRADVNAQKNSGKSSLGTGSIVSAIKIEDLKKDLYDMAGDHFRGRESGTLDEMRVSVWLAEKARAAGLKPAGDDGTYFQFFDLVRNRVSVNSTVTIDGKALMLWKDVLVAQTAPASVSAPIVFVGNGSKENLDKQDLKGKAVAIVASTEGLNLNVSLRERRYPGYVLNKYRADLLKRGAAAIIFVADDYGETSWSQVVPAMTRGLYDMVGGPSENVTPKAPVLWIHKGDADLVKMNGTLTVNITIEHFTYPEINVVGKIEGTNSKLAGEYVLFSGHQDHDGVRQAYGNDSIYNGADDNGSVSVALLAIARAFKEHPGQRSALFVWHGAEERGLIGSRWFAAHPTVPKNAIVAVLNGDMIGRNNPDSAALLGVTPPHRNSSDLVTFAMSANAEGPKFKLDTTWDRTDHIEGWYFRSDHLSYARAGIPAVFYTTLLHPTYHTPMDEANRIDYAKLKRMTEWMYLTGLKVANANSRPQLDAGFKLER